jgi:hypothetical protein
LQAIHLALVGLASARASDRPSPPWIHALDPASGSPAIFACRLPDGQGDLWLPPVDAVLFDPAGEADGNEAPRLFPLGVLEHALRPGPLGGFLIDSERARAALGKGLGEAIGRFRFVTPVEVVDEEVLTAPL